jgi:hypothetical protein
MFKIYAFILGHPAYHYLLNFVQIKTGLFRLQKQVFIYRKELSIVILQFADTKYLKAWIYKIWETAVSL